jgi:hypothetical protein
MRHWRHVCAHARDLLELDKSHVSACIVRPFHLAMTSVVAVRMCMCVRKCVTRPTLPCVRATRALICTLAVVYYYDWPSRCCRVSLHTQTLCHPHTGVRLLDCVLFARLICHSCTLPQVVHGRQAANQCQVNGAKLTAQLNCAHSAQVWRDCSLGPVAHIPYSHIRKVICVGSYMEAWQHLMHMSVVPIHTYFTVFIPHTHFNAH